MSPVRPPTPAESRIVSELILQSDCGLLPALFGADVARLLAFLAVHTNNPYGRDTTLVMVADRQPGGVLAALVGSRADAARRASLHTAALLARWYGPALIARLPRLASAETALHGLHPLDYYISHIAVLPAYRNQGFGRELLRAGEERARRRGARRCVLDVEERNDRARSFYERLGYREVSPLTIRLGRHGVFVFCRLAKDL